MGSNPTTGIEQTVKEFQKEEICNTLRRELNTGISHYQLQHIYLSITQKTPPTIATKWGIIDLILKEVIQSEINPTKIIKAKYIAIRICTAKDVMKHLQKLMGPSPIDLEKLCIEWDTMSSTESKLKEIDNAITFAQQLQIPHRVKWSDVTGNERFIAVLTNRHQEALRCCLSNIFQK